MDLNGYDRATLAGWWCDLNSFRWPADFPRPEPADWKGLTSKQRHRHPDGRMAWSAINAAVDHGLAHEEWRRRQAPVLDALRQRLASRGIDADAEDEPAKVTTGTWRDRPPML